MLASTVTRDARCVANKSGISFHKNCKIISKICEQFKTSQIENRHSTVVIKLASENTTKLFKCELSKRRANALSPSSTASCLNFCKTINLAHCWVPYINISCLFLEITPSSCTNFEGSFPAFILLLSFEFYFRLRSSLNFLRSHKIQLKIRPNVQVTESSQFFTQAEQLNTIYSSK